MASDVSRYSSRVADAGVDISRGAADATATVNKLLTCSELRPMGWPLTWLYAQNWTPEPPRNAQWKNGPRRMVVPLVKATSNEPDSVAAARALVELPHHGWLRGWGQGQGAGEAGARGRGGARQACYVGGGEGTRARQAKLKPAAVTLRACELGVGALVQVMPLYLWCESGEGWRGPFLWAYTR